MTNLNIKIENLIQENADDFLIAKEIKYEIKSYLESLNDIFNTTQGKIFFLKHTKKIDGFIKIIYKYLLRKHFGNYIPFSNSIPITLIAIGSYGREQLCVYSDIDILLLYKEVPGYNIKALMQEFMTIAWDSGLQLGSRVHEVDDIEKEVRDDITIKTSILESRMIYGSNTLWLDFTYKLQNIRKYKQKEFILEKLEEHKNRLTKYPLNMQANIKDGYGGLRESNMLYWVANVTFGVNNTRQLIGTHFTEEEYKAYRIALEYIFRVRNALHLLAKKKLDSINFDILPDLASKLGYIHSPRHTKERQCMSKLFASLHTIHNFSANIVKKISRKYLFDVKNISTLRKSRIYKNLYVCDNKVYTSYSRKSINLFDLLLELNKLPKNIKSFDNSYTYFARNTIVPNQNKQKIKQKIKHLLEKENLFPFLRLFYNANLFVKVFPFTKKIMNQPQFDGYHIHPVDIHTINSLKHLVNIKDKFVLNIFNHLSKEDKSLLNILTFFHDTGKGRNKEHSLVGELIYKKSGLDIGISKENIDIGIKVIRQHNHMSYVATTQDIFSQKVILAFTALIGTKRNLDILYCLTYADINSVGKSIYNNSHSILLKDLYLNCLDAFLNTSLLKESARRIKKENAIKNNIKFKNLTKSMQKNILNIKSTQVFLIYKASNIIDIAVQSENVKKIDYKIKNEKNLIIQIIRVIPLNLGYLLGKLSFLNVSAMHIFKLYNEKKYFEIIFSENIQNNDINFIEEIIKNSFDMTKEFNFKKPIILKENILLDLNHSEELIQIQINAKDQKGLFGYVATILDKYNIEIRSAKINSKNTKHSKNIRINDLILIEKNGNFIKYKDKILDDLSTS